MQIHTRSAEVAEDNCFGFSQGYIVVHRGLSEKVDAGGGGEAEVIRESKVTAICYNLGVTPRG